MGKTIISVLILLLGLYYIFNFNPKNKESFENHFDNDNSNDTSDGASDGRRKYKCPNVLIRKGNTFYLHNNKVAKVPIIPSLNNNLE